MERYKLLKDLPTVKAGATFREIVREVDGSRVLKEYGINNKVSILVSEINNFDEWFEEIQEPTDSIHWKPQKGEKYWVSYLGGNVSYLIWSGYPDDYNYYNLGRIYRTKEECEKAHDRELAEVRLRRTSTFKPDFKNRNGGWIVTYDHSEEILEAEECSFYDSGEPVRYETEEDALKSIRKNEQDWLTYFGVEDC